MDRWMDVTGEDRSLLDDAVGWFQGWLGRRRESLREGVGRSTPPLAGPSYQEARALLASRLAMVSPEQFDGAFRRVVEGEPRDNIPRVDLPDDSDLESQTVPIDPAAEGAPFAWDDPPQHLLRRDELARWLERWVRGTDMRTLGDPERHGRRPWLRVGVGSVKCHLNADTTRAGVETYLELVRREGERLPWYVVPGRSRLINEIAVGRERVRISGFQLYTDSVFRQTGRLGGARAGERPSPFDPRR